MKLTRQFLFRILLYMLGVLFLAFSVAFAINSDLGISPVSSLPYSISIITGAQISVCIVGVFAVYILLQFLLLGKAFKWYNVFQLVFSTLFGYCTDFAKRLIDGLRPTTYLGQLAMLLISIVLIAIGIALYVDVKLIPMPSEGLTLALTHRFPRIPFHNMKILQDCATVGLGVLLSLLFLHRVEGVREGTLLSVLLVGRVLALVQKIIKPFVERVCFPAADEPQADVA